MTDKQHDTQQDTQKTGRDKTRGRGDGRGHNRTHTAATEHTTDSRSGRDQRGTRTGSEEKDMIYIFKGEKREKRR